MTAYHEGMTTDDYLRKHLELCTLIYLRMLKDGSWPWKEEQNSPNSEHLVESKDRDKEV